MGQYEQHQSVDREKEWGKWQFTPEALQVPGVWTTGPKRKIL